MQTWFSQFRKKRQTKKILQIRKIYSDKKYKTLISKCSALSHSSDPEIKSEACRLMGLSLYKIKKHKEALKFLSSAAEITNYRQDWFNYSIIAIHAQSFSTAEKAYKNMLKGKDPKDYSMVLSYPIMAFQIMQAFHKKKQLEKASSFLNELQSMYIGLHTTDNQQMAARGMPFFNHFLTASLPLIIDLQEISPMEKWWNNLYQNVDDSGKELMKIHQKKRNLMWK